VAKPKVFFNQGIHLMLKRDREYLLEKLRVANIVVRIAPWNRKQRIT